MNTCCNSIVFWLFEMLYEVNCTTHLHAALCIYNAFIFWSMNSLHTNTHSPHPLVLVSAEVGGCWWCLEVEQEDRLLQEHLLDWHHLQQTWTSKENHDTLKKSLTRAQVMVWCSSYSMSNISMAFWKEKKDSDFNGKRPINWLMVRSSTIYSEKPEREEKKECIIYSETHKLTLPEIPAFTFHVFFHWNNYAS